MKDNQGAADPDYMNYFKDKTVAVLGYGSYGFDHARKLRDSGATVLVVLREETPRELWEEDHFDIVSVFEAVDRADILQVW